MNACERAKKVKVILSFIIFPLLSLSLGMTSRDNVSRFAEDFFFSLSSGGFFLLISALALPF